MLVESLCIAGGFALGIVVALERVQACENRTKEQIDADVRKELEFYKNSCNSLTEDVSYLRKKVAALKGEVK